MHAISSSLCRSIGICTLAFALLPGMANAQSTAGSAAGQGGHQSATGASAKGTSTASGAAGQSAAGGKSSTGQAVTFLLIPLVSPAQEQWMKSGCWAKLHDDPNFTGDTLTLSGPIDMPNMVGPFGIDWKGKISSIETGPKTTLTIYDNENFRDPVSTFKPGQRVADVSKKMGFFDEMSSLKIHCTGTSSGSGGTSGK
ncbi:beta/gamma crystallin domain-containing protein [Massilia sp. GCM10023247]|uniref:beta/gamma crystallin domain-containing protein n=1 Tax=Massilia sp. GCM10023247 TaxID=3252643 RepID=UPI003613C90A